MDVVYLKPQSDKHLCKCYLYIEIFMYKHLIQIWLYVFKLITWKNALYLIHYYLIDTHFYAYLFTYLLVLYKYIELSI